jgi:hypothetical protein
VPREKTRPPRRPRVQHADVPATLFLRVLLLASLGLVGSVWALIRHYEHPMRSMRVQAPAPQAWDAGAGFVEIDLDQK